MSRLLGRLNLRLQMPHPWRRSSPGGHSSGERMYLGKPSSALCDEFPRTGGGDTAYGNAAERGEAGRRAWDGIRLAVLEGTPSSTVQADTHSSRDSS